MENKRNAILTFRNLLLGYSSGRSSHTLLPEINGSAEEGELVGVIGRNGVGKSTLLRTLAGLQDLLGGNVIIEGQDLAEYSRTRLSEKIGYLSTEIVRVSNMKVFDLVSLGRFPHTDWLGRAGNDDMEKVMDAIEKTGMSSFCYRNISELSDGERQRAMIAMLLAQDTGIMVMDEPTAFLDISSKFEILHLLHELARERNKTIIFSTHDLTTAIKQADKIWFLCNDGLTEGAPEDLMLTGTFNSLFDRQKIWFNSHDGTFSIMNTEKGKATVKGKGEIRFWTEQALIRAGYQIIDSSETVVIETPSVIGGLWRLSIPGSASEYKSLYEIICRIKELEAIS